MKSIHYFLVGLACALGMVVIVGAALLTKGYTYQGSRIDPPLAVNDFRLTSQDGQPIRFEELHGGNEGKVALVYFGYTRCPDVCPVTLGDFKKIKAQLKDQASQVQFIFITVDPERDTPDVLGRYMANFDPGFAGLTGSRAELEPVWKIFGIYQEKQDTGSAAGYLVDHSSYIYLIDQHGDLRLTYQFGTNPGAIEQDVAHLLKEK